MKIYMDVCCFNRPFDDQTQDKIRIESDAILAILSKCMRGQWQLLASTVIDVEIEKTPDEWKKSKVHKLYALAKERITLNETIIKHAFELQRSGLKAFDSLHVAAAEYSKADVFLTTDKTLLQITKRLKPGIKIVNPVNWFMEVFENE